MLRRLLPLVLLAALGAHAQQTQPVAASPLANAASRLLSDAAASPVMWQPWNAATLERAKKADRPIFLAIGFAASNEVYRLHREAFVNSEIAETINTYFVPVLLDRLEHPEVAEAYATVLGTSSVPANFVLTPDLEPFAMAGAVTPGELNRLLVQSANRWANERASAVAAGKANLEKARTLGERRAPSEVDAKVLDAVIEDIGKTYDATNGGFGPAPKTPQPMTISFLLRYADRAKNDAVRAIAVDTLRKMARLPVRDQLGGGFHRATRDAAWRDPYFEKMAADQALLAIAYLEAWQLTRDPELESVVRTTLDYAVNEMRGTRGAFDAAQDAHSLIPGQGPEFVNAAFYLWDKDEIARLIGRDPAAKVFRIYGMERDQDNLPILADPDYLRQTAEEMKPLLAKMLDLRQKRPQPFREFSEMAGLNGLMISALARAGAVLGEKTYVDSATSAARTVTAKLWIGPKKTLYRSDALTRPFLDALAEDYALLVQGLLDLFDASYDPRWLDLAKVLQQRQDELFWDASLGRYTTGTSLPPALRGLLVETDFETPAVNSVAARNLLRLAALTGNTTWGARPAVIFQSFGGRLRSNGVQLPELAGALADAFVTPSIVVVTGDPRKKDTYDLLHSIHERWEPMRAVVFVPWKGPDRVRMTQALPFTAALQPDPEVPIAYVCSGGECRRR